MVLPRAPFGSLAAHVSGLLRPSSQKTSDFKSNEFITQSDDGSSSSESDESDDGIMAKLKVPGPPASATRKINGDKARLLNKQASTTRITESPGVPPAPKPAATERSPVAPKREPMVKREPDTGSGLEFSSSEEEWGSDDDKIKRLRLSPLKAPAGERAPSLSQKPGTKNHGGAKGVTLTNQPPPSAQGDDSTSESSSDSSEDDDGEGGPAGARTAPKLAANAQYESETSSSGSSSSSDGSGSSSSSDEEDSSKKNPNLRVKPPPPTPRPQPKQQKPTKPSALAASQPSSSSDSSESESSDDEDEVVAPSKAQPSNPRATSLTSTSSSASEEASKNRSDSSDDDADTSSSEEDDSGSDVEMADQSFAMDGRDTAESQALHNMIPAGFELRKADQGTDASDVVRTFRKAQLEGKQLFYFTVPASVPITVIEKMEIPLERAQLGLPIFSHDGEDYGVTLDDAVTSQTIKLMIPHKGGDKYSMLGRGVDQTMHVRRVTQLPGDTQKGGGGNKPRTEITASKAPRPQPAGLRNRFLPIGVNEAPKAPQPSIQAAPSSSRAVSSAEPPARMEATDTPKSAKKSKKRKHEAETNEDFSAYKGTNSRESSPTKTKKVKTSNGPALSSQLDASNPMKSAIPPTGSRPVNGVRPAKETPVVPPIPRGKTAPAASTQPLPPKTKASAAVSLGSSTQPAKQSEVPLPPYVRPPGSGPTVSGTRGSSQPPPSLSESRQSSPSKESKKAKKKHLQKKDKAARLAKLGSSQSGPSAPRKETPVPNPHLTRK